MGSKYFVSVPIDSTGKGKTYCLSLIFSHMVDHCSIYALSPTVHLFPATQPSHSPNPLLLCNHHQPSSSALCPLLPWTSWWYLPFLRWRAQGSQVLLFTRSHSSVCVYVYLLNPIPYYYTNTAQWPRIKPGHWLLQNSNLVWWRWKWCHSQHAAQRRQSQISRKPRCWEWRLDQAVYFHTDEPVQATMHWTHCVSVSQHSLLTGCSFCSPIPTQDLSTQGHHLQDQMYIRLSLLSFNRHKFPQIAQQMYVYINTHTLSD